MSRPTPRRRGCANFRAQSSQDLIDLLHPAVIELYDLEACQAYLEQIIEGIVQVEVLNVSGPDLWLWEIDDRSTETRALILFWPMSARGIRPISGTFTSPAVPTVH